MADPTFEYAIDTDHRLITMRLFGREPSDHYADHIIAVYWKVPELWRYNRLIDHRKFRGLIVLDDLQRMRVAWQDLTAGRHSHPRVAFLTRSALTRARIAAHGDIFPDHTRRVFTNVAEAMDWVRQHEMVE